ncbi:DNRLRE domain-containing protein [Rubritalea tangerina]|uniref:DNRLRE domain-containing protein n=1 Tax=Rubritalea tangerina TaxID=430798 RepID=A0ABW4ZEP7_9BACT
MKDKEKWVVLIEKVFSGEATDTEVEELEAALMGDADVLDLYQDITLQHSLLASSNAMQFAEVVEVGRGSVGWKVAAIAALVLLSLSLFIPMSKREKGIASISESSLAQWGQCSLPTTEGEVLSQGALELLHGTASLSFESGAVVSLEAPAAIELVSEMQARVLYGRVVAEVPEQAIGFRLDTPDLEVKDLGTVFSVYVDKGSKASTVDVIDGEVEVFHEVSAGKKLLVTNEGVQTGGEGMVFRRNDGEIIHSELEEAAADFIEVSTAYGEGGHATIISNHADTHLHPHLLLVKNPMNQTYKRKSYMKFDIGGLKGRSFGRVSLKLMQMASPYGYASLVPDSKFEVYALKDGVDEDWDPAVLTWENAPANVRRSGWKLEEDRVELVGAFTIPRGQQSGEVEVEGSRLAEVMREDSNGVLTLIVVRRTTETRPEGLVHAFAGNQTPGGRAPRLRVELD